jgi:uncharacterized DUF497 family protein
MQLIAFFCHEGACLLRCPDFDDLEVHEVFPIRYPLLKQLFVIAFHQLKTPVEVCLNPTVNILQPFGRHSPTLPESPIDWSSITILTTAMTFEWDRIKAKSNLRKHQVSFEEAATALLDPLSKTDLDPDHSIEENRFITFGMSARRRLLVVSYTDNDETIRLISARLASRREREIYEEY